MRRWKIGEEKGEVVAGRNDEGNQSKQLYYLTGLSFDHEANLYVSDHGNNRIQRFDLIAE